MSTKTRPTLQLDGGATTTTKPRRRAPRGTGVISSVGELQVVMLSSAMLKQFFCQPTGVCYVCGRRQVRRDIAEAAIKWGIAIPSSVDLFGDPTNALVFELKGASR